MIVLCTGRGTGNRRSPRRSPTIRGRNGFFLSGRTSRPARHHRSRTVGVAFRPASAVRKCKMSVAVVHRSAQRPEHGELLVKRKLGFGLLVLVAVAAAVGFYYWPFQDHNGLRLPGIVEIQEIRLGSKLG